jgi:hypothetical protein
MRVTAADGHVLDAAFDIEGPNDNGYVTLILESAGGASGSVGYRNHEYPQALALLLSRFATADADLLDVYVDSRATRHLSHDERRVTPQPWGCPST